MKNVLLTGWQGFIGSHIYDAIQHDFEVKLFHGDVTNLMDCERNLRDIHTVLHLASVTYAPLFYDVPDIVMDTQIKGTLNLLRNHKLFARFILFSSAHVYGKQTIFPTDEDSIPNPLEPYSVSKLAAEQLLKCYGDINGFDYVMLRPQNNYGPRQNYQFLIPTLIQQALTERKMRLKGNSQRMFIYVADTVDAVRRLLLATHWPHHLYNLAGAQTWWISEVAAKIAEQTGVTEPIDIAPTHPRVVDVPKFEASYQRILTDFGWSPRISIDEGLARTIAYYRGQHA